MRAIRGIAAVLPVIALVAMVGVSPAFADPPTNDTEAGAIEVAEVPFTHSADTSEASPGGPTFCSNSASVFYRFTPTDTLRVQADLIGSEYGTTLGVYTRDDDGKGGPGRVQRRPIPL